MKSSLASLFGLDVFTRSGATTARVTISLLVKTILPIVATTTMRLAWGAGGGWGVVWLTGVALLAFAWLRITIVEVQAGSPDRVMALRRALLGVREYAQARIDSFAAANKADPATALQHALDGRTMMAEVMAAIFFVVGEGNSDLNKHIRVTFMEPDGEKLVITFYRNSDMQVPKSMSQGRYLNRGAGVAGKAWELGETVVVSDVLRDLGSSTPVFSPLTRPHQQGRIKSIMSIPVYHRSTSEGEQFLGVLNIDADQPNHFVDDEAGINELEILLRPYVRFIELAFVAEERRIAVSLQSAESPVGSKSPDAHPR